MSSSKEARNVIIIFVDSLRWDHVGAYHRGRRRFENVEPVKTPYLDRFAEKCVLFENAYPEALPTIPARMQVMTGQRTLPSRGWEPLKPNDVTLTQLLREEGYTCGLVSDVYHYRKPGMNYHADFHSYRWVRGQEYDPYVSSPPKRDIGDYVNDNYDSVWRERISQFLANTDDFRSPEDWFAAKTVRESVDWLRNNRSAEKVFLWIDSFDPHEPWDPPGEFDTYTDPSYEGPRLIMPMGGEAKEWASSEEADYIRGLYAGEVASVDRQLGKLFDTLEEEGYMEDSLIFLLADHGHPLGDHGKFLKGTDRMYSELLKSPFMVHLPGGENAGRRTEALTQFHDVAPTVLHFLGRENDTGAMHGLSLWPVLKGDGERVREAIITGYHRGIERCIRDERWSYVIRPEGEPDELYDLKDDWKEEDNLIDEHPGEAKRLSGKFGAYFRGRPVEPVKGLQGKYEMGSSSIA